MNSLDLLKEIFPGKINLPLLAVGKVIGFAEQTTKNKAHKKTFPIPIHKVDGKCFCHILDVADFLDKLRTGNGKKRGRPTKAEQFRRLQVNSI